MPLSQTYRSNELEVLYEFLPERVALHEGGNNRRDDFWHLPIRAAPGRVRPMEPSTRTVSYRRRRALFLLELICMVGLCGLGYLKPQPQPDGPAARPVIEAGLKVKFE